jgi:hypothetical protein
MRFRKCSALLLLLASCATTTPSRKDQVAIPVGPLVAPKPVVIPAPVGLAPPAPLVVLPEDQVGQPRTEAQASPEATRTPSEAQPPMQQEPDTDPKPAPEESAPDKGPPPAVTTERRPECEPVPKPHRGGDALHDWCADTFPPNRFPGHDVLVNGKRFDALQVGARVLWEIKTDRFDTYTSFLQDQVIRKQVLEFQHERDLARACG